MGSLLRFQNLSDLIHLTEESNRARRVNAAVDKLRHVPDATYDAQGQKGCMDGTCEIVLQDLLLWSGENREPFVCWLSGMAGTGKTSIALSFCDQLHKERRLGGSFFCSRHRGEDHSDARLIVPSLSRLLARVYEPFKLALAKQLEQNPDAAHKRIKLQAELLLQQPLSSLLRPKNPLVLVVDAVDECSDQEATENLLNSLIEVSTSHSIKLLISSRPIRHVNATQLCNRARTRALDLSQDRYLAAAKKDIARYLEYRLGKIQYAPPGWISTADIQTLVRLANGVFLVASTAADYICDRHPVDRLRRLTGFAEPTALSTKPLDAMYTMILNEASSPDTLEPDELKSLEDLLATILALRTRLSVQSLGEILGVPPEHLRENVDQLQALIKLPSDNDAERLDTLHSSFSDFVASSRRAPAHIHIDQSSGNLALAHGCLNVMRSTKPIFDPSNPPSSISGALAYAGKQWSSHTRSEWVGEGLERRLQDMTQIGDVVNKIAAHALSVGRTEMALEWLEEGRALVWRDILRLRTPMDKLRLQHRELADQLQRAAAALEIAGPTNATSPMGESNHRALARNYEKLVDRARQIEGFETLLRPRTIAELATATKSGPVVIVNVYEARCDALILLPTGKIAPILLKPDTYQYVEAVRRQLFTALRLSGLRNGRGLPPEEKKVRETVEPVLSTLWYRIVRPVLAELGVLTSKPQTVSELPHVTWCTTGSLAFLPLHAAGDYRSRSRSCVFDFVVSSYTPTIDTLLRPHRQRSTTSSEEMLIVSQTNTPGYSPLPGVAREIDIVSAHFPRRRHLDNKSATIAEVLGAFTQYSRVHFACHAVQDLNDPTKSAFLLHDNRLELSQLMSKSMENAELAVLSACQTATGADELPDEAMHLAASMLAVGYRNVVGTMWSIGDDDAPLVVDVFYAKYKAMCEEGLDYGSATAYALHEAVGLLRKDVGEVNFLKWVPFVHFGG